jgi:hypothetical protein
MGTYLSAYIEVDYSVGSPPFTAPDQVLSLTEGSFSFSKDYEVFDALAGGRDATAAPEDRDPSCAPLIAPRGMPSPCSQSVGWDYFRLVTDPPIVPDRYFWPAWRCVSSAVAAGWLRGGSSHEAEFLQTVNCGPRPWMWLVVSEKGHFNASWLRLDEFDASLKYHGLDLATLKIEYRIIRSALSQLVEQFGLKRVRLVVWFS